jgi:DNA-binding response OmpR family regulator
VAKVLVVDDEPDVLLLLRITLEAAGFETGLAADGDEALQRLRKERFDLVILDLMMPVLDGFGVLDALADDTKSPPVVVLTANATVGNEQRARSLGAAAFLAKPYDADTLLARVHALIDGSVPGRGPAERKP